MRVQEAGWEKIGITCSSGRRSLWMRLAMRDNRASEVSATTVSGIELCAGREGDDSHVAITPANPQFGEILEVLLTARYATDV